MKKASIAAVLFFAASLVNSLAQTTWTIGSQTFSVDTLYHATVGPGTTETELRIVQEGVSTPKTNNIFYTVTDLTNPYVEMRAAKAGNNMRMIEVVPEIAERMSKPGENYFAGVNADFYSMTYPYGTCGMCVAGGFFTNSGSAYWSHIVFDETGQPTFAETVNLQTQGTVGFADGSSYTLRINATRGTDNMILYTPQWQSAAGNSIPGHTGTNVYGTEIQVRPKGKNIMFGNSLQLEVISAPERYVGNMAVPSDGYVISAHGNAEKYLSGLKKGDLVTVSMPFYADGKAMKVKELLGGCPIILIDGVVQPTSPRIDHLVTPEPRTAVGHNADKSKLYMAVVDGRNAGGSAGVTQTEIGEIMKYIGCSDAMNFDGGGSSTMYIDGLGVKNIPSRSSLDNRKEGEPRAVVNALFAVSTAPVDNVIARIELRDKKVSLSTGETYTPVVYAYNQYGALIDTDLAGCRISVPEKLGTINGVSVKASDGQYSGLLIAEYNGYTSSVPFYLNGGGQFVTSSVEDAVVSPDAPAEYFMINGVRVSEPARGQIYVRRQSGTVVKTLGE